MKLFLSIITSVIGSAAAKIGSGNKPHKYILAGDQSGDNNLRGAVLGLAAGIGVIILREKMRVHKQPNNPVRKTQALTLGLYLAGGVIAGAIRRMLK